MGTYRRSYRSTGGLRFSHGRRSLRFGAGRSYSRGAMTLRRAARTGVGKGYHPYGRPGRPYSSIASDYKSVDVYVPPATLATSGGVSERLVLLNGLQAGAGFFNRVGRQIQMKSVEIMYEFDNDGSTNQDASRARLICFYDRQPNGAQPTPAQLLTGYDQAGTAITSGNPWSFPNPTNKDRFVILKDIRLNFPDTVAGGATESNSGFAMWAMNNQHDKGAQAVNALQGSFFLSMKDMMTTYTGVNDGTVGALQTGALFLMALVENNNVAGPTGWIFAASSRLRYVDC